MSQDPPIWEQVQAMWGCAGAGILRAKHGWVGALDKSPLAPLWAYTHLEAPAGRSKAQLHRATGAVGWVLSPRGRQEQIPMAGAQLVCGTWCCAGDAAAGVTSPRQLCTAGSCSRACGRSRNE